MPLTTGNNLHPADKAEVLRAYVHRFTCEHIPVWAREKRVDGTFYAPQYANDAEWLCFTTFTTRNTDGRLDRRIKQCFSNNQTWPLGKALAQPFTR